MLDECRIIKTPLQAVAWFVAARKNGDRKMKNHTVEEPVALNNIDFVIWGDPRNVCT